MTRLVAASTWAGIVIVVLLSAAELGAQSVRTEVAMAALEHYRDRLEGPRTPLLVKTLPGNAPEDREVMNRVVVPALASRFDLEVADSLSHECGEVDGFRACRLTDDRLYVDVSVPRIMGDRARIWVVWTENQYATGSPKVVRGGDLLELVRRQGEWHVDRVVVTLIS